MSISTWIMLVMVMGPAAAAPGAARAAAAAPAPDPATTPTTTPAATQPATPATTRSTAAVNPNPPVVVEWSTLGTIAPLALGALLLAGWAGVFRRRSIRGPSRLAGGESVLALLLAMLLAFVAWVVIPAWYFFRTSAGQGPPGSTPQITPGLLRISMIASLVGLAIMLGVNALFRRGGLRLLGLGRSRLLEGVASGIVGAVILIGLVFCASFLTEALWQAIDYRHEAEHELLRALKEHPDDRAMSLMLLASACVVAPLFEEVFFRGHLQTLITHGLHNLLRERVATGRGFDVMPAAAGYAAPEVAPAAPVEAEPEDRPEVWVRWLGVVMASLLFALVHAAWSAPPIFILSICLGYAYERTGNLWTVIVMHAAFNITSTLIFLRFGGMI